MNKTFHLKSIWLIAFLIFCGSNIWGATEEVRCLVFTGASDQKSSYDIETYNRIYIGENGFLLHSKIGIDAPDIELVYSMFNHLEFKDDTPTMNVESILNLNDDLSCLKYSDLYKTIEIITSSSNNFSLRIFNLSGMLIATFDLGINRLISVDSLTSGAYVAVATDEEVKLMVKFIVK